MSTDAKAERRREILEAALRAFSEKGYDKTSMADIVTLSGLSKGTLYWYFKNKQALFVAMIEMVFEDIGTHFQVALAETQDLPPPERLRNLLTGMTAMVDEMLSFAGLYADFFSQAWQIDSVRERLAELYSAFIAVVVPVIQAGIDGGYFRPIDAHLASRTILGAIDGFWFQQILNVGAAQPMLELHADLVIRGLMKGDDTNTG